ncbi:Ig lambda-1 chain C region [Labeo rohita]|uniref:Ig lambda-1 chain C region n=1 Tax=Labeo rohita TaxID=84645 RepID=A0ABQ8MNH4_LABRO|nr:Ig lambda-1 chain C region [Labeo rohita]
MLFSEVGSNAVPFAILSPPFHLKTDLSGLTILVCVVHDIHQGELQVAWISSGTRGTNPAGSNLLQGHSGIQNTMSVISVPSNVRVNNDLLLLQALRILLLKITIFNVLMTVQAVIKW